MITDITARHEPMFRMIMPILLIITTWGVMHVIVAVFVNSALEAAHVRSNDVASKARKEYEESCNSLCEVFRQADSDGNGVLTKDEFAKVLDVPRVVDQLNAVGIDGTSAVALFDILDLDGNQTLDGTEFVEGVMRSRGDALNKDMIGLRCDVWRASISIEDEIERASAFIRNRVQRTTQKVEAVQLDAAATFRRLRIAHAPDHHQSTSKRSSGTDQRNRSSRHVAQSQAKKGSAIVGGPPLESSTSFTVGSAAESMASQEQQFRLPMATRRSNNRQQLPPMQQVLPGASPDPDFA